MMTETAAASYLAPWSNFCVMTGSSAAALTGLMFVVITLVNRERLRTNRDATSIFSTPTVMHFCAALLVAAVLDAPWRSLVSPAILIALAGLYGLVHILRLIRRTRRLTAYIPDLEDWTWFTILPLIGYGLMFVGAIALANVPVDALFVLAGSVVLLIFIGIHNAWDVVTYIAAGGPDETLNRTD